MNIKTGVKALITEIINVTEYMHFSCFCAQRPSIAFLFIVNNQLRKLHNDVGLNYSKYCVTRNEPWSGCSSRNTLLHIQTQSMQWVGMRTYTRVHGLCWPKRTT